MCSNNLNSEKANCSYNNGIPIIEKIAPLAQKVNSLDINKIAQVCVQDISKLVGARYASLYILDETSNMAEVAFIVRDDWHNKGIGSFLLKHLAVIAKRNGISGFTAEVLIQNRAMQKVFNKSEFKVTSKLEEDVYSFRIDFS